MSLTPSNALPTQTQTQLKEREMAAVRTDQEVLDRMDASATEVGFMNFERAYLAAYLPFDVVKRHLKDGVAATEWSVSDRSALAVTNELIAYLPFAWDKANNCRGLSSARSLQHLKCWLWLLGFDDVQALDDYEYYGKPHLVEISEAFGFDWVSHDDGSWTNSELSDGVSALGGSGFLEGWTPPRVTELAPV